MRGLFIYSQIILPRWFINPGLPNRLNLAYD